MWTDECQSKQPWKAGWRRHGVTSTSSGPEDWWADPHGKGRLSPSMMVFAQIGASSSRVIANLLGSSTGT
ncbi:hypothetical protein BGL70_02830 [Helicobacter pylori]|nr:hypothetical protein BGL70_02830 [Helicobacter pylori]